MIKNKYTKTVDTLKISDEALEKAVRNVRAKDFSGKVITMKEKKSRRSLRAIPTAAACLAAVVAVGGIFWTVNRSEGVENSFTLSVNAEEINGDTNVIIPDLGFSSAGYGWYDDEDGAIAEISCHKTVQFPVVCEGNNIESVTYSVEAYTEENPEMFFIIYDKFDGIIEQNADESWENKGTEIPNMTLSTAYTVDYNNQPTADMFGVKENGYVADPVQLAIYFVDRNEKFPNLTVEQFESMGFNTANDREYTNFFFDVLRTMLDDNTNKMKIDVTANFTDGTSQTKTIQLGCEYNGTSPDSIQLVGRIVDEQQTADSPNV